ncbi:MAG: sulfatase-like hydrolase/transferase [Eubacteriales bacterium]
MSKKKNFLIFMTDHQRGDLKKIYKNAITPNIDKLQENGVRFENAYCPSPHCCPSRATFFSGLYPSEHGVWNNVNVSNTLSRGLFEDVKLFSEDLKEDGYQLYFGGKWHISAEESPEDRGFVDVAAMELEYKKYPHKADVSEWDRYKNKVMTDMSKPRQESQILRPGYPLYQQYGINENPYNDKDMVEAMNNCIKNLDVSKPFCVYASPCGPHDPYCVPQKYLDMYDINDISLPDNYEDDMHDKPNLYKRTKDRYAQLTDQEHLESVRHYLAFCTYEDALFGMLIDTLKERNLLEDTVVMYLSDHGDYVGAHGLWAKGLPCFREAYQVCSTIGYGGIRANNKVESSFVSLADYAPTILELANIKENREFTGKSLVPFLKDEKPTFWRNEMYSQSNGNEVYGIQRAVFDKRYKYVFNGFDYDELYDLVNDPEELYNLLKTGSHDEIVKEYCEKLWKFAYDHKDSIVNDYIMTALVPFGPGIIL